MHRLKIAIATAGRFHVLDLARELNALGHEVSFYSYVPLRRAMQFGLPRKCHRSLLPFVAPVLLWERVAPKLAPRLREWVMFRLLNWAVILKLEPCDVLICMSGIFVEAPKYAKRRHGAQVWLERGSRHVLSQDEILSEIPGAERPSALVVHRELEGYALADRIVVPSSHVEESFRRDPAAHTKLFIDPYGVDLAMFPNRDNHTPHSPFTFLNVGAWSLRKGADTLEQAVRRMGNIKLVHVGPIRDISFPSNDDRFVHVDAVSQQALPFYYAGADAFVLASREEGLSTVLPQALASGLPIVCTTRTGGANLAHTAALAARTIVVEGGDSAVLAKAMDMVINRSRSTDLQPLNEADRQTLSWGEYAHRYESELNLCVGLAPTPPRSL